MTLRETVRLFAESDGFSDEGLNYADCPECGRSKKLMVGVCPGGLFYRCLAVSCSVSGLVLGNRVQGERKAERRTEPRIDSCKLNLSRQASLRARLPGLEEADLSKVRCCLGRNGSLHYVYPILSPLGELRGEIERRYDPKGVWTHPYAATGPMLHWQFGSAGGLLLRRILLVEDVPSAMAAASALAPTVPSLYAAVALCGTHLSQEAEAEIREYSPSEVYIALDSDATEKAIEMTRSRYFGYARPRMLPLNTDLKNMEPKHIRAWWGEHVGI